MKRAILVGMNYTGTSKELRGCLNDVETMKTLLQILKFDEVQTITENEATTAAIISAINLAVQTAESGDVVFLYYSGHGTRFKAQRPDGYEEVIVPIDFSTSISAIAVEELRDLSKDLAPGAVITIVLDCCYSGTTSAPEGFKVRAIEAPPEKWILRKPSSSKGPLQSNVLISGGRADQLSLESKYEGVSQGAATFALSKLVRQNPEILNDELVAGLMLFMVRNNLPQRPEIDGDPTMFSQPFLDVRSPQVLGVRSLQVPEFVTI